MVGGVGKGGGEARVGDTRGVLGGAWGGLRGCWYQAKSKGIGNCKKCRSKE